MSSIVKLLLGSKGDPIYAVTSSANFINEGSSVTFTITTANVNNGTTLFFSLNTIFGTINSSDFTGGAVTGSFSINNNTGSVTLTLANDVTTEGSEQFQLQVRTDSISGTVVVTSSTITIGDISTSFAAFGGSVVNQPTHTYHVFTNNTDEFVVLNGTSAVDYLVVGGGSGGHGSSGGHHPGPGPTAGAGHGGQVIQVTDSISPGTYPVTIGAGGENSTYPGGAQPTSFRGTTANRKANYSPQTPYPAWPGPVLAPAVTPSPEWAAGVSPTGRFGIDGGGGHGSAVPVGGAAPDAFATQHTGGGGGGGGNAAPRGGAKGIVMVRYAKPSATCIVTSSTKLVYEGSSVTFNISLSNISDQTLYYTLTGVTGTVNGSDFSSGSTSGSFTTVGGSASVVITIASDGALEGVEKFKFEVRSSSVSGSIIAVSPVIKFTEAITTTGGTVATLSPDGFKYHTFTSPGSFVVSGSSRSAEVFMCAGGGGGGGNGGGGGGGFRTFTTTASPGSYPIIIGGGGGSPRGGDTSAFGQTVTGGGSGSSHSQHESYNHSHDNPEHHHSNSFTPAQHGGSGGGGNGGAPGISGQGHPGGPIGGGGATSGQTPPSPYNDGGGNGHTNPSGGGGTGAKVPVRAFSVSGGGAPAPHGGDHNDGGHSYSLAGPVDTSSYGQGGGRAGGYSGGVVIVRLLNE